METTYKIIDMERISENGTVVKTGCVIIAREKENYTNDGLPAERAYRAITNISVTFEKEEGTPFIPFEELTEEIVIDWVKEKLGQEGVLEIENRLQKEIDKQKVATLNGTPW
jgi:hypothetical protein